ncbi:MAG TPA: DUF4126 family protein [Anaerolineales bacterium]|nr:DUF4126 family protein [Anaerolineales bacterium]
MKNIFVRIFILGFISGLRSMLGLALASRYVAQRKGFLPRLYVPKPLRWMETNQAVGLTSALMAGEMAADKLPILPARTAPGPLFGRAMSGGLVGVTLAQKRRQPPLLGALFGVAGALLGAYSGVTLRKEAGKRLQVPDLFVALLEDSLALLGGEIAIR